MEVTVTLPVIFIYLLDHAILKYFYLYVINASACVCGIFSLYFRDGVLTSLLQFDSFPFHRSFY